MKTLRLISSIALLVFSSSALRAASLYWDAAGTSGASLGGSTNWDQTSAVWFNGGSDIAWVNANNDDAIFSGTAGTVTLTENISAGNLYFTNATGNYLITNATGAEVLTVAGAIDTGGGEHAIAAPIANSGTLNKNGAGRLHLAAANSLSGVMVNQGELSVENNSAGGGNVTVADGAALELNGGSGNLLNGVTTSVTINGSGITNSGSLRNVSGVTTFYGQIILGENNSVIYADTDSALVYDGENGPLTDNGNDYNLIISASGTGNVQLGATSIGGTLIVEGPASCYCYLNSITPTAWQSTYISPGASLYVENNNSFGTSPATLMTTNVLLDGGTIISGGTYAMYATDGITVTANGGTLTNASGTWTTCNIYSLSNTPVTLACTGSMRPGGANTTAGTINLGTGTLIKSGTGDCNLGYAQASLEIYSNIQVNGSGSLTFNYDSTGGTSSLGAVPSTLNPSNIWLNGGSLHVGHSTTIGATRGIYVTTAGGTIEDVVSSGGTVTINSPISGPGSLNFPNGHAGVISAITLAANNTYAGTTTIGVSNLVTVGAGGATGTLGTGNTTDNGTLTFNRTGSYSYGGVISGSGIINKNGSGIVTLTGQNTYSSNTTITAGTLLINNPSGSGTGTGSVAVNPGGTLGGSGAISGVVTVASGGTLSPGAAANSVGTLTINNNLTLGGNVSIAINKSLSPSNSAVIVTGTLGNSGTAAVKITNLGPTLAPGDKFQVFSQLITGATVPVSGGGAIWNNNLGVDGSISVASVPTPVISGVFLSGTNLVFSGTNGVPTGPYALFSSTNLALPRASWTQVSTGSYDGSGKVSITNAILPGVPQKFYFLQDE